MSTDQLVRQFHSVTPPPVQVPSVPNDVFNDTQRSETATSITGDLTSTASSIDLASVASKRDAAFPPPPISPVVTELYVDGYGSISVIKGDPKILPASVQKFVADNVRLMRPRAVYICDGSQFEFEDIVEKLQQRGVLRPLKACENSYVVRTDPSDTQRVESKTFVITSQMQSTTSGWTADHAKSDFANWMPATQLKENLDARFPACMRGRMMYVIPFSMGPIGGYNSKYAVQLTDSPYVVANMRIMTRVSPAVWDAIGSSEDYVRCVHSIGCPRPVTFRLNQNWACNPEKVFLAHWMERKEIWSFGSDYGGNSLLGKKCLALRMASVMGRDEGWLAEHMAILSVTTPTGEEFFIAAAFPSNCGKTVLSLTTPTLPGWKVRVIGDDIAWLRCDSSDGQMYAMNPENGMFGIIASTNSKAADVAVRMVQKNSILTNVAETSDGHPFWQGKEPPPPGTEVIDWRNQRWQPTSDSTPAHSNARFTSFCKDCPTIHPDWDSPKGVPISAIIFGARRFDGIPLVYETSSWKNGVFCAATMKTDVASDQGIKTRHDPMGMRAFMGYNFGQYLNHWLAMEDGKRKMPKIFMVNWYRRNRRGACLWPGFGENIRVLDWVIRRIKDPKYPCMTSPIGCMPVREYFNLEGLDVDWDPLMKVCNKFWRSECNELREYFAQQLATETPEAILEELDALTVALQSCIEQ